MAKKNDKLTKVAVAVGGAIGKADAPRTSAVKAGSIVKKELAAIPSKSTR